MRSTKLFGKTMREEPAETESASHRLLLKAGMIRQVAAGVYSYLPLAWRSLRKIENIIRQEMDAADGQEVRMPVLHPLELWEESGRAAAFGQNLFALKDRRQRSLVMAPTHEEVVTSLINSNVHSYRDLPKRIYQIQTKFRDEARPRAGLIRVREFDMKDAYSFDVDEAALAVSYNAMLEAYENIYRRCGLPAIRAEADSGAIGGKESHEFILLTESGEDLILICTSCGYAANAERADSKKLAGQEEEPASKNEVHTPGIKTIEDLSVFLSIPESKTLKAVVYMADGSLVFTTIRGDMEVNETKLKNLLHCRDLRFATDDEVRSAGIVAGSASMVGVDGLKTIADDSIRLGYNFVAGSNRPDFHFTNVNYPRDFVPDVIADIALTRSGDSCSQCGEPLEAKRGIEIGHIFKLGTFYTDMLGATYLDSEGVQQPMIMGCYGIGIGRLLAAVLEHNYDDKGMVFPTSVSPYQVYLATLNTQNLEVVQAGDDIYTALMLSGIEVLYDDRDETVGVKLNDADLLGFPLRIVVSARNIKSGNVEVSFRRSGDALMLPLEEVVVEIGRLLEADTMQS